MIPSIEVENTQGTGSLLLSRGSDATITITMTFIDFDSSLTAYDALAIETPMGTFPAEDLRDAVRILAGEPLGEHQKMEIYDGNETVCVTCPRNSYGEYVAWDQAHPQGTAAEESK